MKRGVIVAAAAILMAGAASAHLFSAPLQASASHGTSPTAALQQATPQGPQPASQPSPRAVLGEPRGEPAAVRTERRAALDVHKAPVPLQTKPKPPVQVPVQVPAGEPPEANTRSEAGAAAKADAPGPTSSDDPASEAVARRAIEADGYKGVQVVRKGENGMWYAKALRGRTAVQLVVDSQGTVSTAD